MIRLSITDIPLLHEMRLPLAVHPPSMVKATHYWKQRERQLLQFLAVRLSTFYQRSLFGAFLHLIFVLNSLTREFPFQFGIYSGTSTPNESQIAMP